MGIHKKSFDPAKLRSCSSRQRTNLRSRISDETARIMIEEGIRDHHRAKRKACAKLGDESMANLPSNTEVEIYLAERQRVFDPVNSALTQQLNLEVALKLMEQLKHFSPRLCGRAATATATLGCPVVLHLFADTTEDVILFLIQQRMQYAATDRLMAYKHGENFRVPLLELTFEDRSVELFIFPANGIRQAPLSPVDGRPMKRSGPMDVEKLLDEIRLN